MQRLITTGAAATVIGGVLSLCLPPGRAGVSAASGPPHFRSSADLVVVDVSVKAGDAFVPTLTASDFLILDDGVPQTPSLFVDEQRIPLAVTLLIDRSRSMVGERLEAAKAAATAFLETLGHDDRAEVLAFNERVTNVVPFAPGPAPDLGAIESLTATGMTGWFEAVLVALQNLERTTALPERPEQRAIVMLTDGEDTSSVVRFDEVLDAVRRSNVMLYAVSLRGDRHRAGLPPSYEMAQLANGSGGRAVAAQTTGDLMGIYQNIASELQHLYRIGFVPEPLRSDGRWHTLSVRVPGRDVHVRARSGYFAPTCATYVPDGEHGEADGLCPVRRR